MNKIQSYSISRPVMDPSSNDSQIVTKPVELGTPRTLSKEQILSPYHRLTEPENLGVYFNKSSDSATSLSLRAAGTIIILILINKISLFTHFKVTFLNTCYRTQGVGTQSTGWIPAP